MILNKKDKLFVENPVALIPKEDWVEGYKLSRAFGNIIRMENKINKEKRAHYLYFLLKSLITEIELP